MPNTKRRRKECPESRRACILHAARCVFARQGYNDTVVEDIAVQAGVAKGTLYLYFKSKEEVFLAALQEDARSMEQQTRERMEQASNWQEKLKAYLDIRLEYLETRQDFIRIYLAEFRSMMVRGIRISPEFFTCVRESEARLAQVFAAAIAKEEVRDVDPEMAARTVSDLTRGLMERRLLGWSAADQSEEAKFALDLLCRALERRR